MEHAKRTEGVGRRGAGSFRVQFETPVIKVGASIVAHAFGSTHSIVYSILPCKLKLRRALVRSASTCAASLASSGSRPITSLHLAHSRRFFPATQLNDPRGLRR